MKKILIALLLIPSICFSQHKMQGNGGFDLNANKFYLVNSTDSLFSQRTDSVIFYKPARFTGTINTTGAFTGVASTWTGQQINSLSGTASTASILMTGSPFVGTGTTGVPLFYMNGGTAPSSWGTSGTYIGVNAVSGFVGDFLGMHVNGGANLFSVSRTGAVFSLADITGSYFKNVNNNFHLYGASTGTGALTLYNGGESDAAILQFGGTNTSFPGFVRNGAGIDVKLADNSAYTSIRASKFTVTTSVFWSSGTGSPEGVVTANIGSIYSRSDGGAGTTLYVKESGTGNTGWIAK